MKKNLMKTMLLGVMTVFMFTACQKEETAEPVQLKSETSGDNLRHMQVYPLMSVSDPAISGYVSFQKAGPNTKVTIVLDGTMPGGDHPAHIHFNSAAQGGGIAISLKNVNGGSGRSTTIVNMLDNGTSVTYEDLLNFNGYVNVHLSPTNLATLIAQGDIGSNF
ncbi:MAG: CHRD domain-containing protein [Bacteroidia bacterium]